MTSALTHSPADVVRWLLINLGLGTDPAADGLWPIHATNEPDWPDNMLTLYDTDPSIDGRIQQTGEITEHRGVQVQVRGVDHPTAWAKVEAVRATMDETVNKHLVIVESSAYIVYAITRRSGPLALGRESATNRFLFTINVAVALRQLS
jgi:hypothetical protein